MLNTVLIQCIGAIAYALLSFSYFKKEKIKILLVQIFAYVFFSIYYFLLSGVTGAECNIIGLAALGTIFLLEKYASEKKGILLGCTITLFGMLLLGVNIMTYENIFSILPMIASVSVIISFLSNKESVIRGVGILSAVCWLTFTIIYTSYIGIVYEAVTFIAVVVAFFMNLPKKNIESK